MRGSIQKSNNPSPERLEELLFLGSEITRSADFWPRLFLNPEITMISDPIVDGLYFWRRRSRTKREIIDENIRHNSGSKSSCAAINPIFLTVGSRSQRCFAVSNTYGSKASFTTGAESLLRSVINQPNTPQRQQCRAATKYISRVFVGAAPVSLVSS